MSPARVAVVVADSGRPGRLGASLEGFAREVEGRGEVVLVNRGPMPQVLGPIRVVASPRARLVPELWRDGLATIDADWVAFSTTEMVPRPGWLDELLAAASGRGIVGVGGVIAPGNRLRGVGRAVYLLRYLNYAPGGMLPDRPSGENSLYRADRLAEVGDAWSEGFWESEVQARLEAAGARWARATGAVVDYQGSPGFGQTALQRLAHSARFGAIRSEGSGPISRGLRALATPVVPPLMLARIVRRLVDRRMAFGPWIAAMPGALALAGAWASGETLGALSGRERNTPEKG